MILLDGRKLAAELLRTLKMEIATLPRKPKLAVMLVGSDPASQIYVGLKKKRAEEIGMQVELKTFFATTTTDELTATIDQWNADKSVDGILVQLPLPKGIDTNTITHRIDPKKDADGFLNAGFIPPVHAAVRALIQSSGKNTQGFKGSIVGNSKVFTEPLQKLLKLEGMDLNLVLREQREHHDFSRDQVIVIAIGVPCWLTAEKIPDHSIVIDIGTNRLDEGVVVGDVDLRSVEDKPGWISPSPGGVGPLTVAYLLSNTVQAAKRRIA
ncbi:bifunctional 5,10-methylenetetrahydrofolate dehydrogenase/5,10-methenyltetrahydrofolate cyclohydrolase [Candidatus Uhrbacteria bacterium]|nr:bifunctional 5,10-methylenetetrahydrofolate dehydrogenase/5,10-methenyltetrahydrofolate cyclohydrolase [Candidatus Uhrbacteria bacterium]